MHAEEIADNRKKKTKSFALDENLDVEQSEEYQQAISEKNALASLHIKRDLQYDMELRKYKDRMDEMEKKMGLLSVEKLAAEIEKVVLMSGRK